jgi:hypothetical protein
MYDGKILNKTIINGPPTPLPGYEIKRSAVALPPTNKEMGVKTLTAPAFDWVFGCSATSGAMIAGYYDRNGYPNMYTGPTNGGVIPLDDTVWPHWLDSDNHDYPSCPLTASRNGLDGRTTRGSIDDYWVSYYPGNELDPYITNGWSQHAWGGAIGDYMKTSQSAYGYNDGATGFYANWDSAIPLTCTEMEGHGISNNDGTYGIKLFYEARGYEVADCYAQQTDNKVSGGFSFSQYKAEIDAGRPVMLHLQGIPLSGLAMMLHQTEYISMILGTTVRTPCPGAGSIREWSFFTSAL